MSVALSVVFTGLCALVADGDGTPGQVLFVDAKGIGEVGGVVLPEHSPTLIVPLRMLANASTSDPTRTAVAWRGNDSADQIGLWDLTGSDVRIRVQGGAESGLALYRQSNEGSSWPEPPRNANDPAAWRDLRFVADMKALTGDGRIDPSFVAADDSSAARLPVGVAARVHLDAGVVEAGLPSDEAHRDDIFEFRGTHTVPKLRQALTDSIRWSLRSDARAVVIEILPTDGRPIKRLEFAPSATPHRVSISGLPAMDATHTAHQELSDEEMAALHFGAYYQLLMNKPIDTPLPRLWRARVARNGAGFGSTIFCPPALFTTR